METLREFGPDIWIANGPPVELFGPINFPSRMIVVRLGDGGLWINSPVSASEAEIEHLAAIGPVRYLVAPTRLHVWRLRQWKPHFPDAQLWAPPGIPARYKGLSFDGVLSDEPPVAWARDIDQVVFRGNAFFDEVEFFHMKSQTLMITDFIQNYPPQKGRLLRNALMSLGGVLDGGVPRDIRLSFTKRDLARASFQKLLAWDFQRLIVAHGDCVETGARSFVERAFRWLQGSSERIPK